mmetsp:Transcript_6658/g.7642  ORF Transcript_6658/g.7642 Transcript_6658/m.7642 type:complete len:96 (-) Transcript_6658:841-1128(-)
MLHPKSTEYKGGKWETWESPCSTLEPLLKDQVAGVFLPWMEANSEAVASSSSECWAAVKYGEWVNDVGGPQKYQYKTLKVVRSKYKKLQKKIQIL